MSFEANAISGVIGLDESPAFKAIKAVEAEAKRFKESFESQTPKVLLYGADGRPLLDSMNAMKKQLAEVKNAGEAAGKSGGSVFKGLAEQLGDKSAAGQTLKLLKGGGAIAGLGLATLAFENLGLAVEKFATTLRQEDASWQQALGQLFRDLPVIGNAVKAWDSIIEAVTGAKAAEEAYAASVKAADDAFAKRTAAIDEGKKATLEWRDAIEELRQQYQLLTASAFDTPKVTSEKAFKKQIDDARKKYLADSGVKDDKGNPGPYALKAEELQKAQQQADAMRTELRRLQATKLTHIAPLDAGLYGGSWRDPRESRIAVAQEALDKQVEAVKNLKTELSGLKEKAEAAGRSYSEYGSQALKNYVADAKNAREQAEYQAWLSHALAVNASETATMVGWWDKQTAKIHEATAAVAGFFNVNQQRAKELRNSLLKPDEVFGSSLAELKRLYERGFIDKELVARGVNKAAAELAKENDAPQLTTREIRGRVYADSRSSDDPLHSLPDIAQKQLEQLQKLTGLTADQVRAGTTGVKTFRMD